jgi:hypothetical protein
MQLAVIASAAGAVGLLVWWVWRLTGSAAAAATAGVVALASPTLAAYSSAVMSECPSLLFLMLAVIAWEWAIRPSPASGLAGQAARNRRQRSLRPGFRALLAGMAFGVAVNMREPLLMVCCWPAVSCLVDRPAGRWLLLAAAAGGAVLTLGAGVVMAGAWDAGAGFWTILGDYRSYMAEERLTRGFDGWANLLYLLGHTALAAPLGVGLAAAGLLRRAAARRASGLWPGRLPARRAAWLAASAVPLAAFTWYNPDLSFNWRLALPVAWMLAPLMGVLGAEVLAEVRHQLRSAGRGWARLAAAAACLATLGWLATSGLALQNHMRYAREQSELFRGLQSLPERAVVIPGPASTTAQYLQRLGFRPEWRVLHTETTWTGPDLARKIRRQMDLGRRAFVYSRPAGWKRGGDYNPEWDAVAEMLNSFTVGPGRGAFVELLRPRQGGVAVATFPAS